MSFVDMSLQCSSCGSTFTFGADDQSRRDLQVSHHASITPGPSGRSSAAATARLNSSI